MNLQNRHRLNNTIMWIEELFSFFSSLCSIRLSVRSEQDECRAKIHTEHPYRKEEIEQFTVQEDFLDRFSDHRRYRETSTTSGKSPWPVTSYFSRNLVNSGRMNTRRTKDELFLRWRSTTINVQNNDTNEPTNGPMLDPLCAHCLVCAYSCANRRKERRRGRRGKGTASEPEKERERKRNKRTSDDVLVLNCSCTMSNMNDMFRYLCVTLHFLTDHWPVSLSLSLSLLAISVRCLPVSANILSPSLVHHGWIFLVLLTRCIHPDSLTLEKRVWNVQRRKSGHMSVQAEKNVVGSRIPRVRQAYCLAWGQCNRQRQSALRTIINGEATEGERKPKQMSIECLSLFSASSARMQLTESDEKKKHT